MIHHLSSQIGKNVSLVPKRAVFRETPSEPYQQVVERQYQESALASIRLEFERVLQAGSMSQQQVNDIFQPREEHIRQVFGDDVAMADNRVRILQHLGSLKSQVLAELTRLGVATTAGREAILQRTSARYQEFITFLQGRGVISQIPPRVETPPLGPALLQAYETTRDLASEFRNIAGTWTDVPPYFSEAIYARLFGPTQLANRDRREHLLGILAAPEGFHQEVSFYYRVFNEYMNRTRSRHTDWQPAQYLEPFFTAATARVGAPTEDSRLLTQIGRELSRAEAIRWADAALREEPGTAPEPVLGPRPVETPREQPVDPSRNLDLEWHDLSRSWTDIPTTFSESFFQRAFQLIPRPRWRPFLASGLDHPEVFRRQIQMLHRVFQAYARERGGNEIRLLPSFSRLMVLNPVGNGLTHDRSLDPLVERAERQVAAETWRDETLVDLRLPERAEMLSTLLRIETTLLRQETPSSADLRALQRYVGFVERELFQGQQLTWRDVDQAQFRARDNVYILKGQRFPIRRAFSSASARTPETYSHTELIVNGSSILPLELPRLIETLNLCHRRFESVLRAAGGMINFSTLATQLEAQPEELRLTQQREYFRSLTRTIRFERSPTFEEFPVLLGRLLGQYNSPEQKTAREWSTLIERQQLNPELNADAYHLLWLARFYVRTRSVSANGQMTMTQFAEQLLRSNVYQPAPDRPPQRKSDLMRTLGTAGNVDEQARNVLRIGQIEDEYDIYLERMPAIREIVDFERSLAEFERRIFDASLYQSNPPADVSRARDSATRINWPFMIGLLNTQEEVYLSSPDGQVRSGEGTNTVDQPLYDRNLAERYHRLKTSNALFQDIVRMGELSAATPERFTMRLSNIINRVLTPNGAANE